MTGGAGFVGSHLVDALLEQGWRVRVIDNLSTGRQENLPAGEVEFVEADIRDYDAVARAVAGLEVVFHQAAVRSVPKSIDDPVPSISTNVDGTLNVVLAAHRAGVSRLVYASSSTVYGALPGHVRRETDHPRPISPYGVSKLAGEELARVWALVYGLPTVSLRYFNVFGPRQHPESKYSTVFPAFITALRSGRAAEVHGDGLQSRDFTYVENVVHANLLAAAADERASGEAVNVGCGETHTVLEVLGRVARALGVEPHSVFTAPRPGDVRHTQADLGKAADLLGYKPPVGFGEGLERTVAWFAAGR